MSRPDSAMKGRLIFLVGARRSGTNWVERILTVADDFPTAGRTAAEYAATARERSSLARMTADLWRPAPVLVSALLLCVVGAAFYQNQRIDTMRRPRVESRYFLGGQTRAPQGEKPIVVHRDAPVSLIVEFTPSAEFKSYQAQILSDSGQVKYSIPLNPQSGDVSVGIVLPAESLKEGKYNVVILGKPGAGDAKDIGGGSFYLQFVN